MIGSVYIWNHGAAFGQSPETEEQREEKSMGYRPPRTTNWSQAVKIIRLASIPTHYV